MTPSFVLLFLKKKKVEKTIYVANYDAARAIAANRRQNYDAEKYFLFLFL
jgi:hypothetical protein